MMVRIVFVLLLCLLLPSPVLAEKRVAFVVGIDKYDNLSKDAQLRKARSDAVAVARLLKDIGFDVIAKEDVTRSAFNSHWQDFLNKLTPGDTAALYFAGHGVEFGGRTYLLPRDVPSLKPGRDELLRREALSLQEFLADLKEKGTRLNLVILDACRENPFEQVAGRSVGGRRGLAMTEPPEGTFIVYSAGVGETALDVLDEKDRDPNSVYTRNLLPLLRSPGLTLTEVAEQVRLSVRHMAAAVRHRQTPAYYNQVLGRVCLAGGDCGPRTGDVPGPARSSEAAEAWVVAKDTASIPILEAFIRRFGDTFYGDLAKVRLAALKAEQERARAEDERKKSEDGSRAKTTAVRVCANVESATNIAQLKTMASVHRGTPAGACILARIEALQRQQVVFNAEQDRRVEDGGKRAQADLPRPGREFRDCTDVCPEMVVVPAGSFMMGSNDHDPEKPLHKVTIQWPFAVGKFEVTFGEWDACVADAGCTSNRTPSDNGWGKGRRPVINVSWHDAQEYVTWLSRRTGKTYRLVTEAEWEYVARAGTSTLYAFGDIISTSQARYSADRTAEVGSFPANGFKLHDLHGNVWEWVQDRWHRDYQGATVDGSEWQAVDTSRTVVRGGSWFNNRDDLRSAARYGSLPYLRYDNFGFRVARTL